MDALNRIETCIEYIRTRGKASGQELSEVLNCHKKNVQPTLYLAISKGYLATTKQGGSNIYSIAEAVPKGMSWAEFKESKREIKVKSAPVKPPSKAKEIVEKPKRTPAETRNALAYFFERRVLGLPKDEDAATTSEAATALVGGSESATHDYEVIELIPAPESTAASAVPPIQKSVPVQTTESVDEVLFLFGHDRRLQVIFGDQRIICTREETVAVGCMMRALEPIWKV